MEEIITQEEVISLAALAGLTGVGLIALSVVGAPGGPGPGFSNVPGMAPPYGGPTGVTHLKIGDILKVTPFTNYAGKPLSVFTYAKIVQNKIVVYGSGIAGVAIGFDFPVTARQYPLVPSGQLQPDGSKSPELWLYAWPGPPGPGGGPTVPGGICGAPPAKGAATLYLDVYLKSADSGNTADADGFSSPTCNKRTLQAQSQGYPVILE